MKKEEKWVISLGGSRIAPSGDEVDYKFLEHFNELIKRHPTKRFVIVTGGGSTFRKYGKALKNMHKGIKKQDLVGIAVTRFHASFLARIFGKNANEPTDIPENMKRVESLLKKNQVVFCGGLRYKDNSTSDGTAANIASHLKCPFINLTNVRGIYTSNPKTNKNAKFIKSMTWKAFNEKAQKIKFEAGQHFVLDQEGARIIMQRKVPTYITEDLKDIERIIEGKSFRGSFIGG